MKNLIRMAKDGTIKQMVKELSWVAGWGKQYIAQILLYVLIGIFSTALGLTASVLGKNIIDTVTGFQTGRVVWIAAAYVVMQLTGIGFSALTSHISTRVRLMVGQQLRAEVFRKILNAQWEPLSQFHSGDLLARCSQDAGAVAGGVIGIVPTLVVNGVQFLGSFFLILYYDYTLALLALLSAPVVLLVSVFLTKKIRKYSLKMRTIGSEMTAFHTEAFQNIQIIKSFGLLDAYGKKLHKLQEKQKDATLEHNRFSILTSSFLSLVGMVVSGLCFFWSVYRLWGNHITFGEMTMFLQLSGTLSGAFGALVGMVPAAISLATAAGRVMEVTQLPAEQYTHTQQVEQILAGKQCSVQLQVEDMDFSYLPGNCVFRQVQLQAEPGQIVALVGPSGGGKTTMLRILLGIVTVEQGSVTVTGAQPPITIPVSPSTRRLFSYVPQDNTLFSGTVAENLRIMKPDATDQELQAVLKLACADDFVDNLPDGIHTLLGERGNGLSEGQIQRLSIARALLSAAPVLLLDEATSALDVQTERQILRNITQHQSNRTCIVTTHRPSVLEVCHRVYRISEETVTQVDQKEIERMLQDF